jgi:hypothetical protein
MRPLTFAFAGLLLLAVTGSADAALLSRLGGQAVYDTDRDITWIADANLAATQTFGVSGIISSGSAIGQMSWTTAQAWIAAMNTALYLGVGDWRLPATLNPDPTCSNAAQSLGSGCSGSDMGHLFYDELGGTAGSAVWSSGDPDLALFQHLDSVGLSWSNDFTPTAPTSDAWAFQLANGGQNAIAKTSTEYAWAVRNDDIAPVPAPAAAWLLTMALVALSTVRRARDDARPHPLA